MADSKGWIKIDRAILENWIYQSREFDNLHAFLDILLTVNYSEHDFYSKGKLVKLKPGQMITSIPILARRWGWSENRVRRFFGVLAEGDIVQTVGSPSGSTLTVVNWDKYQNQRRASGRGDEGSDGSADGSSDGSLYKKDKERKKERSAYARGGSGWKTQAEKSAAVRELAARLDREEREREQRANG